MGAWKDLKASVYCVAFHPDGKKLAWCGTDKQVHVAEVASGKELAAFKGQSRVWVVFSHRHKDEESVVRAYAEGMGRSMRVVKYPGAVAYLFDFTGTTVAP